MGADRHAEAATGYRGAKTGMWLFLFTELLFFGGLFLLYAVFRSRNAGGFHLAAAGESLAAGTFNTAVLLTGSLCMAVSLSAIKRGDARLSARMQALALLSGAVFLAVKLGFEWRTKIAAGIYPGSPVLDAGSRAEVLFYGLYFVMTGIHGLHVLIAAALIGVTLALTRRGDIHAGRFVWLENTALFWHFVDVVWIYLFPLFYLVT